MDLGENLYNLRKKHNLSQEEVAEKLNVTRQTISKWETKESKPDFDKIMPICNLFEISPEELLTGVKKEVSEENEIIENDKHRTRKRAIIISVGVFLYFLSIIFIICSEELFKVDSIIGVSGFLFICAIATSLMIYQGIVYNKKEQEKPKKDKKLDSITDLVAIIFTVIYLVISFLTFAWHITWIIWVIYAAVIDIIKIIYESKGSDKNEE